MLKKPLRPRSASLLRHLVEVVCFAAAQVPANATEPPNELIVCPWGTTQTRQGPVTVDERTVKVFAAGQNERRWDRLALDWQHNTVNLHKRGTPEYDAWLAQEPRDVAAYATAEVRPQVGLVYKDIRWTESGLANWKNYEDISPAVLKDAQGVVYGLHSTALCRAGEMDGVTLFASLDPNVNYRGTFLKPNQATMTELLKKLLVKAGVAVPENASDETLAALAADHTADDATPAADPALTALAANLTTLTETITTLSAEVAALKQAGPQGQAQLTRATLVAQAKAQGKVIPLSAQEIETMDLTLLTSMVEKLGVTVPLGHKVNPLATEVVSVFSAEEENVMAQMGVSREQFAAHKKRQLSDRSAAETKAKAQS